MKKKLKSRSTKHKTIDNSWNTSELLKIHEYQKDSERYSCLYKARIDCDNKKKD